MGSAYNLNMLGWADSPDAHMNVCRHLSGLRLPDSEPSGFVSSEDANFMDTLYEIYSAMRDRKKSWSDRKATSLALHSRNGCKASFAFR